MTRKGHRQPPPWTTRDLTWLRDNAGTMPVTDLCRALKRSYYAVTKQASLMGVSTRYHAPKLVWCDHCATWRTAVDKDGVCEVCRKREQIQGLYMTNTDEYQHMTAYQRQRFEEEESKREERGERARLKREGDKVKKRTERIREITGRNPRKGDVRKKFGSVKKKCQKYEMKTRDERSHGREPAAAPNESSDLTVKNGSLDTRKG